MQGRSLKKGVQWVGAVDWDRRLFDALVPLPDGTSYNAYLVQGSEKTALVDTVDPTMWSTLEGYLSSVQRVDYVISHHAEQDHSGSIPMVLARYPEARVLTSPKGARMLGELLHVPTERVMAVEDGQELSLGDKTLRFIHTPWVHWPETMCSFLVEEGILFSCDLFGSHLATSDLFADPSKTLEPAKRYFAEIMMPLRQAAQRAAEKVRTLPLQMIAPSHGPVYDRPEVIMEAYKKWTSGAVRNLVLIPYISMHGSTRDMVDRLTEALMRRNVAVERTDLTVLDLGKLASSLIDAATLVVGSPTFLGGVHPLVASAAYVIDQLRPSLKYLSLVGSYSWSTSVAENLPKMFPHLKLEVLPTVQSRGLATEADHGALDALAEAIAQKHHELPAS